jgi:hypothetical protein
MADNTYAYDSVGNTSAPPDTTLPVQSPYDVFLKGPVDTVQTAASAVGDAASSAASTVGHALSTAAGDVWDGISSFLGDLAIVAIVGAVVVVGIIAYKVYKV